MATAGWWCCASCVRELLAHEMALTTEQCILRAMPLPALSVINSEGSAKQGESSMQRKLMPIMAVALWLAASSVCLPAQADGIRLEPLLRLATREPAWAVAVDPLRQRAWVGVGESVREYVLLSAGVVVPAIHSPAHLSGRPAQIVVDGRDVYVATDKGVCRFDSERPEAVTCYVGFTAHGLAVVREHLYVAVEDTVHNECGLLVLDRGLWTVGQWSVPCRAGDLVTGFETVAAQGTQVYLGGYAGGGFTGYMDGAVGVVDVSQPSAPRWMEDPCLLSGLPTDLSLLGGRLYVAEKTDGYTPHLRPGVAILETLGAAPTVIGEWRTAESVSAVAVSLPYAFAAGARGRVYAIDVSNAAQPRLAATFDTGFTAHDIAVSQDHVYVADGEGGLVVLRIRPVAEPSPTPAMVSAEGTLTRVEFSFCQAGETHCLPESDVYLYSDFVRLREYEGRYVQVWGWEVESPECRLLNVRRVQVLRETPEPVNPVVYAYLPVMRKNCLP